MPAALEDAMRRLDDLVVQARVLERETALGADHAERLSQIAALKTETEEKIATLRARWDKERDLVNRIREVRTKLESAPDPALSAELAKLNAELETVQGETPLIRVCVDAQIIGDVISGWTGIPGGQDAEGRNRHRAQAA